MSDEQMTDDQFNARLAEPIVSQDHLFRLMIDMAEQDDGIGQLSSVIWDKMKELKEELEESEKEKGQMAGNGGFCGDPETGQSANAILWRFGRDRIKSLEEENKKLKKQRYDIDKRVEVASREGLKEVSNGFKEIIKEVQEENEELKKKVEAYETLTGVKRGDICAHADPNDDSLYTYKTYEEYEKDLSRQDIRDLVDEHFHGEGMGGDLGHHCIYDWYTDSEEESEEESDDDSEEDQFERDGMGAILGVKTVVTK